MTASWKRAAWIRGAAAVLAAARTGIGVVALVSPEVVGRPWVGGAARTAQGRVLARALGGRDLVLGLGALAALRRACGPAAGSTGRPGRGGDALWVGMGAAADCADVLATVGAWDELPAGGRRVVAMSAGGAAVAGGAAAWALIAGEDRPA